MKLTFLIACVLGVQIMVAQTTQVSGKITDSETGDPLIVAQVFVKGTFVGTTTDDQGAFTIEANAGDKELEKPIFDFYTSKRIKGKNTFHDKYEKDYTSKGLKK